MTETISNDRIWSVLATILDPEFGLSIVDLGLIYDVAIDGANVAIAMTLTTQTCPAGDMILGGVDAALRELRGIGDVRVNLVWEPPWSTAMLTPAARVHLGWPPE